MRKLAMILLGVALLGMQCLLLASATASPLIYTPVNPAFGGNPLNGPVLLNAAQAINKFKDPALLANKKTPGQKFADSLQRSILSRLSRSVSSSVVDADGNLVAQPTTIETADFTIDIINLGGTGQMQLYVVDTYTGQATTLSICQPGSAELGITACVP